MGPSELEERSREKARRASRNGSSGGKHVTVFIPADHAPVGKMPSSNSMPGVQYQKVSQAALPTHYGYSVGFFENLSHLGASLMWWAGEHFPFI